MARMEFPHLSGAIIAIAKNATYNEMEILKKNGNWTNAEMCEIVKRIKKHDLPLWKGDLKAVKKAVKDFHNTK